MTAVGEQEGLTEPERVERWRRGRLIAAGVEPGLATLTARDSGFDVHEFERLVGQGCDPDVAINILS